MLSVGCREKHLDLCSEIIVFLNEGTTSTQKPDIHELNKIIHYTVENHCIFNKTALNSANQNDDKILGHALIQLEKQVHKDKSNGLSCIKKTLDSGPLISWVIQTYSDFFPDESCLKLKTILNAGWTFIKLGFLSFLPLLFDLISDINLASDYARFGFSNETVANEEIIWNCTSSVSSSGLDSSCFKNNSYLKIDELYASAYWTTWTILSVSLGLFLAVILLFNDDDVFFPKNFISVENKYAAQVIRFLTTFFAKLIWPFRRIYLEVKYLDVIY